MADTANRFVLKIGEIFQIDKGMTRIEEDLRKSRKARLSNLRPDLANRFLSCLESYLPAVEVFAHGPEDLKKLELKPGKSGACKSQWYQYFLGEKVNMGEVLVPSALYHVLWTEEKVHRVFAINDPAYIDFLWKKNFMMRLEDEQIFATVYDRQEGLAVIKEKAKKASVFRLLVLPPKLVKELLPSIAKGDYRLILSRRDPLNKILIEDPDVRFGSDAKIYMVYGGEECSVGQIRLNHELFSVMWRDDKVFNVMKYENLIFANYFGRAFDTAWKYSKKNKPA